MKQNYFVLVIFLCISSLLFSQTTETFTNTGNGTFVVPCGVTSLTVEAWGAGGAGGGSTFNNYGGGGGGAGAYVQNTFTVTDGQVISYYIGQGGNGSTNDGQDGENTTILGMIAGGGEGGLADQSNGNGAGNGGGASGGSINSNGLNGQNSQNNSGGDGGDSPNGGNGGNSNSDSNGGNGQSPGGGGGGGERYQSGWSSQNRSGGDGGDGQIRITYTSSIPLNNYCTPSFNNPVSITNVTFAGINNSVNNASVGHESFCNEATVAIGSVYTIDVTSSTTGGSLYYITVYIDWDQDGNLGNNTNEVYNIGINNTSGGTVSSSIDVPIGAVAGYTKMRVMQNRNNYVGGACVNENRGQSEDYLVNVSMLPCTEPTAQVTNLALTNTDTSISGSFTAATPDSDNYLVLYSTSSTPFTPVDGVAYNVGANYSGYTVISNNTNTTFSISGLSESTTYYVYVYSFNSSCFGGPDYLSLNPTSGSITTLGSCNLGYCTPSFSSVYQITNVSINTINNSSSSTDGFESYCNVSTELIAGDTYSINVVGNIESGLGTYSITVYMDWNQDGDFNDANESYLIGAVSGLFSNTYNVTTNITVPSTAVSGITIMRVVSMNNTLLGATPCPNGNNGQAEDYVLSIKVPCVVPTSQPTNLNLSVSNTIISGSFNHVSPIPNGYLVFLSSNNSPPTLVDGAIYTPGNVYNGYTLIDNDNNTTFSSGLLQPNTTYYAYVFSYNNNCFGGPVYNTASPLTGSITTSGSGYCNSTVSSSSNASNNYIKEVGFLGTLNDVVNTSGYSTNPNGYQDFTNLPNLCIQSQGEGVNVFLQNHDLAKVRAWVDWNLDGDFNDANETVYSSGGIGISSTTFGFVIPANATPGNYLIRIRSSETNNSIGSCGQINNRGETEDYMFTVLASCVASIDEIYGGENCGTNTVDISVQGSSDTIEYRWYDAETGGNLLGSTVSGTWTTPTISTTTTYYVTAFNGSCESLERKAVNAIISPIPTVDFTPDVPEVCGEDNVVEIAAAGDFEQIYLIDEDFEDGTLGVFSYQNYSNNGNDINNKTRWYNRQSPYVPSENVWFPAISSGFGGNHFVMSTSDVGNYNIENAIVSNTVDTSNFINLTLAFDVYYSDYSSGGNDYFLIDVSTDNGVSWTTLQSWNTSIGIGTRFTTLTYNLNTYINENNFKIRFHYDTGYADGVAIDNVKLYGDQPLSTAFSWVSATAIDAYSDAACTITYVEGTPATNVYIKPTLTQLEQGFFTFTASATLTNGCSVSQDISITNNTKIWQGITSDWNDANNWLPSGVPTSSNCVIIKDTSTLQPSYIDGVTNGEALNFTVKPNGTFEIQAGGTLSVVDFVNVETGGNFDIAHEGSLIQINDVVNTGDITLNKTTNIRKTDYVYWSTPVLTWDVAAVSPNTTSNFRYYWEPTVDNGGLYASNFGNWFSASGTMELGKGYIIRGPNNFPNTAQDYTATFIGTPNNGTIQKTVTRGSYTGADYLGPTTTYVTALDDNWNLIGNPYPSAISAIDLLQYNTNLEGAVHVWTHGTEINSGTAQPFYESYGQNYDTSDYIIQNGTGTLNGPGTFNGYIASGQGFFVRLLDTAPSTSQVTFTNTMRDVSYVNNQFYRPANNQTSTNELPLTTLDEGRLWLDIANNDQSNSRRILVGYVDGATNDKDRMFDMYSLENVALNFYSVTDDAKKVDIQGRGLPYSNNDQIPLGVLVPSAGVYSISIFALDGLFESNDVPVYIEDTYLNVVHNLKISPYSFTIDALGRFDDRFILRFNTSDSVLGNDTIQTELGLHIFNTKEKVKVIAANNPIQKIAVYNTLGQKLNDFNVNGAEEFQFSLPKQGNTFIINVEHVNGNLNTKKLIK